MLNIICAEGTFALANTADDTTEDVLEIVNAVVYAIQQHLAHATTNKLEDVVIVTNALEKYTACANNSNLHNLHSALTSTWDCTQQFNNIAVNVISDYCM